MKRNYKHYIARIERDKLLAEGKSVRFAAMNVPGKGVHVLFATMNANRKWLVGFYMSRDTYRSIPYELNATPEDFARHGELTPGPNTFNY